MKALFIPLAAFGSLLAALICFALGLILPIVRLDYLYVWTNTYSIIGVIEALAASGEIFLAGVLLVFSVLFPTAKIGCLMAAFMRARRGDAWPEARARKRLDWLGKWSMLDVLILALVVFYAKVQLLSDAAALSGAYFFAASVLFTMASNPLIAASVKARPKVGAGSIRLIASRTRPPDSAPS
ncbi:MAG: paraquat-inducible protein A [Hyphomicrobiales bacterium]|nr:paraquat-inducible protein A [Hyphomicrobiales bacterium]